MFVIYALRLYTDINTKRSPTYPNTKTFVRRQNSFLFDTIALHHIYNNAVFSCILYVGNYQITYET